MRPGRRPPRPRSATWPRGRGGPWRTRRRGGRRGSARNRRRSPRGTRRPGRRPGRPRPRGASSSPSRPGQRQGSGGAARAGERAGRGARGPASGRAAPAPWRGRSPPQRPPWTIRRSGARLPAPFSCGATDPLPQAGLPVCPGEPAFWPFRAAGSSRLFRGRAVPGRSVREPGRISIPISRGANGARAGAPGGPPGGRRERSRPRRADPGGGRSSRTRARRRCARATPPG